MELSDLVVCIRDDWATEPLPDIKPIKDNGYTISGIFQGGFSFEEIPLIQKGCRQWWYRVHFAPLQYNETEIAELMTTEIEMA